MTSYTPEVAALTAERDSLKARVERLEAALRPFATVARLMAPLVEDQPERWPDRKPNSEFIPGSWPVWADFRSAVEALEDKR